MTRTIATAAVIVAGLCTTAMNWRFSYQLGAAGWDSITWATFSVALDITKWVMLPLAARAWQPHKLRALAACTIWLVATIYSFTAAIGFSALNREVSVSERQAQSDLRQTLLVMRQSPRWQSSAACADATAPASKEFCARYGAVAAKLRDNVQDADPQSALLASIIGMPPETVRRALNIFLAIACETLSALGFFAVMAPTGVGARKEFRARWTPPKWSARSTTKQATVSVATKPAMTRQGPTRRDTP